MSPRELPSLDRQDHDEERPHRRRMLWIGGGAILIVAIAAIGIVWWAGSSASENLIRRRLIAQIETATGGRTEIAEFHWSLFHLNADASGIVIHGREAAGEAPYARIG